MDGLDAAQIVRDVAANVPPQKSRLKYTREMLSYRYEVEKEWEAWLKENPKARLEVPPDIDGLPDGSTARQDDWNPDQARDETGKWTSEGEATQEGSVKSGKSAIEKATTEKELVDVWWKALGSKFLNNTAKAAMADAIVGKANELGLKTFATLAADDAEHYKEKAKAANEKPLKGQEEAENKPSGSKEGPSPEIELTSPIDSNKSIEDQLKSAVQNQFGKGTKLWEEDGELTITLPNGQKMVAGITEGATTLTFVSVGEDFKTGLGLPSVESPGPVITKAEEKSSGTDYDELTGLQVLDHPDFKALTAGQQQLIGDMMEQDKPINSAMKKFQEENAAAKESAGEERQKPLPDHFKTVLGAMMHAQDTGNKELYNKIQDAHQKKMEEKGGPLNPKEQKALLDGIRAEEKAAAAEKAPKDAAAPKAEAPKVEKTKEEKVAEKVAKPQAALDHAKAAREHAKSIIAHAKGLREKLKADPNNADLKKQVEVAEKAAKSARAAARKAEKAGSAEDAAKHAQKAKSHAEKAGVKFIGTEAPSVTKAADTEKPKTTKGTKASAPAPKSNKPKVEVVQPTGKSEPEPSHQKQVANKVEELKTAAQATPPSSWTDDKKAAQAKAKEALAKHSSPKTAKDYQEAADAFDAVAKEAQKAGSFWGSSYSSLASDMREHLSGGANEKFIVHPPVGKVDVRTHVPTKSARPIDSIKGAEVNEKTFKDHRSDYTKILTSDEKSAAEYYSGSAYTSINSHLRADKPPTPKMKALDAAIAKAPAPRDIIVNRGMSGSKAKEIFANLKPGDQIHEKAYWSTSAGGSSAFGGEIEVKITVPKGYPIAPIPSKHPGEREYLLRRNSRMQVTKVEKIKNDYGGEKIVAHVTVLHDEEED